MQQNANQSATFPGLNRLIIQRDIVEGVDGTTQVLEHGSLTKMLSDGTLLEAEWNRHVRTDDGAVHGDPLNLGQCPSCFRWVSATSLNYCARCGTRVCRQCLSVFTSPETGRVAICVHCAELMETPELIAVIRSVWQKLGGG